MRWAAVHIPIPQERCKVEYIGEGVFTIETSPQWCIPSSFGEICFHLYLGLTWDYCRTRSSRSIRQKRFESDYATSNASRLSPCVVVGTLFVPLFVYRTPLCRRPGTKGFEVCSRPNAIVASLYFPNVQGTSVSSDGPARQIQRVPSGILSIRCHHASR
jgi:hypothetical protein